MHWKSSAGGYKIQLVWIIMVILALLIPAGWYVSKKFEGEIPAVEFHALPSVLPAKSTISGIISDKISGVRKICIQLIKDNKEIVLMDQSNETPFWTYGPVHPQISFSLDLDTAKMNISDGKALLVVTVWDHSWRTWWNGNKFYLEKEIWFDTRAPVITVLSGQHYIHQGGTGLVIYRLSEPSRKSGVHVGGEFFPGHAGYFSDKDIYVCFFGVKPDQGPGTELYVTAEDTAGNSSKTAFYYKILAKNFKSETLTISDAFLLSKFSEFESSPGWPKKGSLVDKFLFINHALRDQNNSMILGAGANTDPICYWEGAFLRMPNAAPMAGYADHRLYSYDGNIIGEADHLGIDLASVSNASVPAANSGKVVFAKRVGIYGNTVCIDHGFGVFSIYSHLSQMDVAPGESLSKGQCIGRTGTTGWAGGDHLHYGMFVDHVFVNPTEWWDVSWIKNNITDKIQSVSSDKK